MNLEVGEYVRTRKGIGKIIEKIGQIWDVGVAYQVDKNGTIRTDDSFNEFIYEEDILKHSKKIIDLIEVGDYVNYGRVDLINRDKNIICTENEEGYINTNKLKIESIVTKEQFDSIEYRLEE